ncbi:MAG TPA: hypothetical protein VFB72_03805 [Verrucomicrobiae bacterium]|nr:hypothetical protein [Verrucomicrobiae bacterium]
MNSFRRQRIIGLLLLLVFSAAILWAYFRYTPQFPRLDYFSGALLFSVMVVLTLYNGRKKLPFLPLGTSEGWLQFHVYAGFLTVVLFLVHIQFRAPRGWFDIILATLYLLVTVSGIAGLALTRAIPKRLTTRGGEVLFERIPAIRRHLQAQAETLALKTMPETHSATIADFYVRHLQDFFDGPRNLYLHLLEVRRPLNLLQNKINDLDRYLNARERETLDKIALLVRQKDGLDYHQALQLLLRGWLFVHIPLTYSLMIFSVVHIVLVYAFSGGAR